VNVGAQADIVGEIPAVVVGIVVDDDVVSVPIPVAAVRSIKRCDSEVVTSEPEAVGASTNDAPDVVAPEATLITSVFPGMIEVETFVIPAPIMAHPFAVTMDVRGLGMTLTISIGAPVDVFVVLALVPVGLVLVMIGRRPLVRNVSSSDVVVAVVSIMVVVFLRECGQRKHQGAVRTVTSSFICLSDA